MNRVKTTHRVRYWTDFQKVGVSKWVRHVLDAANSHQGELTDPFTVCTLVKGDLEDEYDTVWVG